MRDQTHQDQIKRQAKNVLENPKWKKVHTEFINSIYDKAYQVIEQLKKTPEGREKIKKMYGIENEKGYPSIFGKNSN